MLMLKNFKVDSTRSMLTPDARLYQANMISIVETARKNDESLFINDGAFLPSWSKFVKDPVRAKGFFVNVLQAMFEGKHNNDALNMEFQTGVNPKVSMMFLPGSTTNQSFDKIISISEQALQGFVIIPVYGGMTTNRDAERLVLEKIEIAEKNKKSCLILSAGMAQRSFSIPQITHLFLAYDGGEVSPTSQKISRALTPHNRGKVGHIISLSFDPNRDDKFDSMLIETAQNYQRKHGGSLKQAMCVVIKTVDLFSCQEQGRIKIEVDEYLNTIIESKSLDRIIGKIADFDSLDSEMVKAIACGNFHNFVKAQAAIAQKGKIYLSSQAQKQPSQTVNVNEKMIENARKVIASIAENIEIIYYQSNVSLEESFKKMDDCGLVLQEELEKVFGIPYSLIKALVIGYQGFKPVMNRDLLELKLSR